MIDMADRNGSVLRRRLRSAERFSERAIRFGSSKVKTRGSKASALLSFVTFCDQRFCFLVAIAIFFETDPLSPLAFVRGLSLSRIAATPSRRGVGRCLDSLSTLRQCQRVDKL